MNTLDCSGAPVEVAPSDYAVTRDLTDWINNHRETFEQLGASKHPAGGNYVFDPVLALRFATELKKLVETFERHWAKQVKEKVRRLNEEHQRVIELNRDALLSAGDERCDMTYLGFGGIVATCALHAGHEGKHGGQG